ncbi:apoptosis regulatory protein Siva-like [Vespa crabro]|uniref:apoptosis regulatory protein Siva-like n=1 Tax=Vespa crabro TaxID=7445 RepID=UPI001F011977|nr:apoptosis regulatory protein Siva-like [Vespa crabro]XP_046819678.1 apoptosis regulatory protein Siva-like [Vespa crabro]XP_046819679.1 apoptosis regulatory protein Siva-like [Vespa crabro]XP_046819680.1 apoptosis regulatory protein Siva-like [Vespa crabro]
MTKRACPYEENLPPQLKVHVGQREIDNGVAEKERMKQVYDKTLNLLKEGVKEYSQNLNKSEMDLTELPLTKITYREMKPERTSKQMILNNKLQLENSDKIISDVQVDLCGCCRIIDSSSTNKCFYCDQVLCSFCLCQCIKCCELFCQNCSLPIYDTERNHVCLNCYY